MKCKNCDINNSGTYNHVLCMPCASKEHKEKLDHLQETAYCAGWKQGYLHFEVEPWNMDAIALMQEAYINYKYSIK